MNTSSDLSSDLMLDLQAEYVVERILNRRIYKGHLEYFVKWQDYPNSDSTWEKADKLNCQELIDEYETLRKSGHSKKRKGSKSLAPQISGIIRRSTRSSVELRSSKRIIRQPARPMLGYKYSQRDLQILGTTKSKSANGELCYYVKWRHSKSITVVTAECANREYPNVVIPFLEQCSRSEERQKLAEQA